MSRTAERNKPAAVALVVPPELGVARCRVPGFASLSDGEQRRAAALALQRDLSVGANDLRLAAKALPAGNASHDSVLIAWCDGANRPQSLATDVLAAAQAGRLYWVGAPAGFLLGEQGAVLVEGVDAGGALPPELTAMLSASGNAGIEEIVLVDRDRGLLPDDRVALWSAASGTAIRDGAWPVSAPVALLAAPVARVVVPSTPMDRALRWAVAAALACCAIAGWRYAASTTTPAVTSAASLSAVASNAAAGALLERIQLAAPALLPNLQSASYGGGAWVLTLAEAIDAPALQRATTLLEANGLAVQATRSPSPRLRVSLPATTSSTNGTRATP